MNKKEFEKQLSLSTDIGTDAAAGRIVALAIDIITKELVAGGTVDLSGLGKFSTALQAGKSGKVPGTNKAYVTQDKMVPKFRASAQLKREVAGV